MSEDSNDDRTVSPSMLRQIDRMCDDFEDQLAKGRTPRIEERLLQIDADACAALLRDLLFIELHHRDTSEVGVDESEYLARFPEYKTVVREVFGRMDLRGGIPDRVGGESSDLGVHSVIDGISISSSSRRLKRQDSDEDEIPTSIDRYRVLEFLGRGGFGGVFLAYDDTLQRSVAIKVPRRDRIISPEDIENYLAEARVVAALRHPHIIPVHDAGRLRDGRCYVVSEYIKGGNLAAKLEQSRIPHDETATLVATIAEALHYAHGKKLIHRDVKPANILIDENGTPFVGDFGAALTAEDYGKAANIVGTPAYMSPEQARGKGHIVDGRSDIFSLGVVLYELLAGERPFLGGNYAEVLERILSLDVRPPRQLDDAIPKELERICLKALSKNPDSRYTTARDMAEDLTRFAAAPRKWRDDDAIARGLHSADASLPEIAVERGQRSGTVFIAYRHIEPDISLANALAQVLKRAGHNVFIDTEIRWGADWVQSIRDALRAADFFVPLISMDAASSEMLLEEVSLARHFARERLGKPTILPIRVRLPFDTPLPYQLSIHLRTIHQETWDGDEDTTRIAGLLLRTVGGTDDWPAPPKADEPLVSRRLHGPPSPCFDPRYVIQPGGAVDVDSRFYVERPADHEVSLAVQRPRGLVTVRGPRQTGKTSLSVRVYAGVRSSVDDTRAAFVDLQTFSQQELASLNTVWRAIATRIAEQVSTVACATSDWVADQSYDRNCTRFFDRCVFTECRMPLLICLDEVDRVFSAPVSADFFASIRAYYNRGAFDETWGNIRWLLVTSSEPSFFIEDIHQSPFNVGQRVELPHFSSRDVRHLAELHGLHGDGRLVEKIMDYVGGHPYLTHLTLHALARDPTRESELFCAETAGGGLFREHLHRYLMQFQREPELAAAMRRFVDGRNCDDVMLTSRLEAAGLVQRERAQHVVILCQLYRDFFRSELAK